ncbi:Arabinose 5-phosphate isomerase KdsD [compost metagenome]
MTRSRLGMTVVMDNDKLVGIVTDGDLRRALLEDESVIQASVEQFMTASPHTIREDSQLSEAEAYMLDNKIRALAVTDAEGAVVGVVEIFD